MLHAIHLSASEFADLVGKSRQTIVHAIKTGATIQGVTSYTSFGGRYMITPTDGFILDNESQLKAIGKLHESCKLVLSDDFSQSTPPISAQKKEAQKKDTPIARKPMSSEITDTITTPPELERFIVSYDAVPTIDYSLLCQGKKIMLIEKKVYHTADRIDATPITCTSIARLPDSVYADLQTNGFHY